MGESRLGQLGEDRLIWGALSQTPLGKGGRPGLLGVEALGWSGRGQSVCGAELGGRGQLGSGSGSGSGQPPRCVLQNDGLWLPGRPLQSQQDDERTGTAVMVSASRPDRPPLPPPPLATPAPAPEPVRGGAAAAAGKVPAPWTPTPRGGGLGEGGRRTLGSRGLAADHRVFTDSKDLQGGCVCHSEACTPRGPVGAPRPLLYTFNKHSWSSFECWVPGPVLSTGDRAVAKSPSPQGTRSGTCGPATPSLGQQTWYRGHTGP